MSQIAHFALHFVMKFDGFFGFLGSCRVIKVVWSFPDSKKRKDGGIWKITHG